MSDTPPDSGGKPRVKRSGDRLQQMIAYANQHNTLTRDEIFEAICKGLKFDATEKLKAEALRSLQNRSAEGFCIALVGRMEALYGAQAPEEFSAVVKASKSNRSYYFGAVPLGEFCASVRHYMDDCIAKSLVASIEDLLPPAERASAPSR